MIYPFLCGASHHHHQVEDDDKFWIRHVSTPRKSKIKKQSKNPYSTHGLDRFSALVAELEEKRQQIYSEMGTQGIVRFVYKNNSNDCVPIVVKLKDKKDQKIKPRTTANDRQPGRSVSGIIDKLQTPSESEQKVEKKKSVSWNVVLENPRRPSRYIPVIILILLSILFFGRSAAVLCTCIGWYTVSTISEEGSNLKTSMKRQ